MPIPLRDTLFTSAGRHLVKAFRLSRYYQRHRRWTQREAAAWWGCSERQWRRYENGQSAPPLPLLKRIARVSAAKRVG